MLDRQEFVLEHSLVHERWSGVATTDEVRQALRGHVEHPDFASIRFILSDERRIEEFAFSADEIRAFAEQASASLELYRGKRWAFVIDRARMTALVFLFRSLLESDLDIEVFSTMEAACAWLGMSSEAAKYVQSLEHDSTDS